jgi:hypothetical protein
LRTAGPFLERAETGRPKKGHALDAIARLLPHGDPVGLERAHDRERVRRGGKAAGIDVLQCLNPIQMEPAAHSPELLDRQASDVLPCRKLLRDLDGPVVAPHVKAARMEQHARAERRDEKQREARTSSRGKRSRDQR